VIALVVYALCALAAFGCAWLLYAAYRRSGVPLLFWSALCFACFTATNMLTIVDIVLLPAEIDLFVLRQIVTLAGLLFLLYGLIWDSR
jgi:hypothetical protein